MACRRYIRRPPSPPTTQLNQQVRTFSSFDYQSDYQRRFVAGVVSSVRQTLKHSVCISGARIHFE